MRPRACPRRRSCRSMSGPVDSLCAFEHYAESHDNFVKNQQRAGRSCDPPKFFQKIRLTGELRPCCQPLARQSSKRWELVTHQNGLVRVDFVKLSDQGVLRQGHGDSSAICHAVGRCLRAGSDEQCIGVAVLPALESDNLVSTRMGTREPQCAHSRLCARTHGSRQRN